MLQEANQQDLRVIWDWNSAHWLLVSREDGPVEMRIILKVDRNGEGCANVVSKGRWDLKNKRVFLQLLLRRAKDKGGLAKVALERGQGPPLLRKIDRPVDILTHSMGFPDMIFSL